MARIYDNTPIEELAMEYVLALVSLDKIRTKDESITWSHETYQMLERIYRRCGRDHGRTHIERAAEILRMVGV